MKLKKAKHRSCPICASTQNKVLYTQKFSDYLSHKIAYCLNCGFVFVNNTPSQTFYNTYYREMTIYEHERDHGVHSITSQIIKKFSSKNVSILDIGCSTGHLLYLLKKFGYKNIEGIDPSPKCSNIAKTKFKVKVVTADIFSFKTKKKYDFLILSSVLEHLQSVTESMSKIKNLLSSRGQVLIVVPDAGSFYRAFEEPFGEFSTEHINFFTEDSLRLLMTGFICSYIESLDGVLYSVWKRKEEVRSSMEKYISLSEDKQKNIDNKISKIANKIIVWGAGSLTKRLFKTTPLKRKTIKLVDVNPNLIGKKLSGIEIISPDELSKYNETILISSFRFKDEILKEIKKRKLTNKVVTFKIHG